MAALAEATQPLFEPLGPHLLAEPLEFIFADHFRQRVLCAELRRFGEAGVIPLAKAREIARFLRIEWHLHHQDEELDLFPAVKRRAQPEDNLDSVLERLTEDHRESEPITLEVARALDGLPVIEGSGKIPERLQKKMIALSSREHRHLAIENSLVMTIARVRLTRSDLARMAATMRDRRAYPAET